MKRILSILFICAGLIHPQNSSLLTILSYAEPVNISIGGADYASHDSLVGWSFIQGYESSGRDLGNYYILQTDYGKEWRNDRFRIHFYDTGSIAGQLAEAKNHKSTMYIRSTTWSLSDTLTTLNYYPNIQTVLIPSTVGQPHEQFFNSGGELSNVLLTGLGTTANLTGYDIDFYGIDPTGNNAVSFSNGYVAGQIFALSDILNISIWQARCLARTEGNVWSAEDGYGNIDVPAILASYTPAVCIDPYMVRIGDVGSIALIQDVNDVSINMGTVYLADNYVLQKQIGNGAWVTIQSANDTTYEDVDLSDSTYHYRYYATYTHNYLGILSTNTSNVIEIILTTIGDVGILALATNINDNSINVGTVYLADNYVIERQFNGGSWAVVQSANDTTYEDPDLLNGLYRYRYKATYTNIYGVQSTEYSNIAEITLTLTYYYLTAEDEKYKTIEGNYYKVQQ